LSSKAMGNTCTSEPKAQFEEKVDAVDAVRAVAEDVEEKVGEAVEQAKETAEDVKEKEGAAEAAADPQEKAQSIAEQVKEKVEETLEQVKEAVVGTTDAAADGSANPQEKAEGIVETVQERVADAVAEVKEAAAGVAEAVADTMTAATAAVTGTLIVEFDDGKGSTKTVDFKSKALGFTLARSSGGGCCTSVPKPPKVVVSKVAKNQQADKLGVKQGWTVRAINGTHVTSLEEATKVMEDSKAKLAEA